MTCLRRSRGLIAAVAICLLLWQSLATGIVAAEAAALAASGFDAGVICHSDGGSGDTAPAKDDNHRQDCCAWCAATASPPLPGQVSGTVRLKLAPAAETPAPHKPLPPILPRAVRDGFSQPPPNLA